VFLGPLFFPSIVGNISGTEGVYGLTVFNGQLFVTRAAKTSNQVSVYNTTTLQLIRNITVVGAAGFLTGLAVSSDNNYLYIADTNYARLYKVDLSSSTTVANWTVANIAYALSLNGLQNILVACSSGKIQEYTSSGSLVRELKTNGTPYHAVEVSKNVLAVSLVTTNQVKLIDVNGTVLYSYAASGFSPQCLGVDKQGYIFVADYSKKRVLVFNPTLTVARPLRVTGNATVVINTPLALFLDPSIGYLYVGEISSPYRVIVFDVSHVSTLFYTP
jgi:DNA-binding beta-propeller fold protein YncE